MFSETSHHRNKPFWAKTYLILKEWEIGKIKRLKKFYIPWAIFAIPGRPVLKTGQFPSLFDYQMSKETS